MDITECGQGVNKAFDQREGEAAFDAPAGSADREPTAQELRSAARVAGWVAGVYEGIEREWPWWKRAIMEYPDKKHLLAASAKLHQLADLCPPNGKLCDGGRTEGNV